MASRRKAREVAVQILYQIDLSGEDPGRAVALYLENLGEQVNDDLDFARQLVTGCCEHLPEIDAKIGDASRHWRLPRMARVDRNILRLGAFELLHLADVPRKVTLNESIELAKRFGDENSAAFVNGVLDRLGSDLGKP